jgi:transcription initiation factor TFIID subunit 5
MENEQDFHILQYFREKGYTHAERALLAEPNLVVSANELVTRLSTQNDKNSNFFLSSENSPTRFDESYSALRDWCMDSLEVYKPELTSILYPIFLHCYLDLVDRKNKTEAIKFLQSHRYEFPEKCQSDIDRLSAVATPEHAKENEFVKNLRLCKFNVSMCSYAWELLLAFLHRHKYMLLLSIINHHLHIKVHSGQPRQRDSDPVLVPILDSNEENLENGRLIQKDIKWDLFPNQKAFLEKAGMEVLSQATQPVTNPPIQPKLSEKTELQILNDLKHKIKLDNQTLPSVYFYTFFNCYDNINVIKTSGRGDLVAAGFSDSTIKLWDLNDSLNASPWTTMTNHLLETDGRSATYKPKKRDTAANMDNGYNLIGHSGPVYGLSFSPDGQFLLSCSQDSTIRLWSMATKTNLVCYRGHTGPVWDVEFGPLGYYFATVGHDKCAYLWSTSHIYPLRVFSGHLSDVNCVKFHPNSCYVFTGSTDKCIRMWDVHSGDCVRIFTGHQNSIFSLAVSNDGRFLASSGEDKEIIVWELASSTAVAKLQGHTDTVWDLVFCAEGNILASCSSDNTIRLWNAKMIREDVLNQEKVEKLGHAQGVMDVEEEPEPEPVLTGSRKKSKLNDGKEKQQHVAEEAQREMLVATFVTKHTPVYSIQFTHTNVLCATGPFKQTEKK